jgi:GntR family transcriptional regulator, transcriptional repressor for pyruvate dehydrogenase complex
MATTKRGAKESLQAPDDAPSRGVAVRRVLKAYEQIAEQLRELIVSGQLSPGERLPNEAMLARQFGVSRATVRESLRVLSAQNLIRTAKGAGGGSYVTLPTVDHLSEFILSHFDLLTASEDVSLDDFLEVRMLLEVPAARMAAMRRDASTLERLEATIPDEPLKLTTQDQFVFNKSFHSIVLEACNNKLLYVSAQPIFSVLQRALARSNLSNAFHRGINDHHRKITEAIAAGDPDRAGEQMRLHLEELHPEYQKVWKRTLRRSHPG